MAIRHNMWGTPEYYSWDNMTGRIHRRSNPRFNNYAEKGVKICERWKSFANFYADMGPRPAGTTLDRIDNNGHYEKSNCRWASSVVQTLNRGTRKDNSSGYTGISWYPSRSKWVAYISLFGKRKTLGYYRDIKEAVEVRRVAEHKYHEPLLGIA